MSVRHAVAGSRAMMPWALRPLAGLLAITAVAAFLGGPSPSRSCTTFCIERGDDFIFGRNFDWDVEVGLVVVNKRGVAKSSILTGIRSSPDWVSRYGSVTFNQYGREMPMGGMNEAGLVIECMWLAGTEYPAPDTRLPLGELQWIQYQLDTAATVAEVIASDIDVRIAGSGSQPLHFLACDRLGGSAAIEFLGGEMVVHQDDDLPVKALTNTSYARSLRFLESLGEQRDESALAIAGSSLRRFVRAAWKIAVPGPEATGVDSATGPAAAVSLAFAVLDDVSVSRTQWRVVYDPGRCRIHFRTRSQPRIRWFDLADFDFRCETPVRMLDMAADGAGDACGGFTDYTYGANRELVGTAFRETDFLSEVSDATLDRIARFPELLSCSEPTD